MDTEKPYPQWSHTGSACTLASKKRKFIGTLFASPLSKSHNVAQIGLKLVISSASSVLRLYTWYHVVRGTMLTFLSPFSFLPSPPSLFLGERAWEFLAWQNWVGDHPLSHSLGRLSRSSESRTYQISRGGLAALSWSKCLCVACSPHKEKLEGCHSQALSAMKQPSSPSLGKSKLPQPFSALYFYLGEGSKVDTMRYTKQNNKPRGWQGRRPLLNN